MSAPPGVVEALAAVMGELPAIGKDQDSTQGYRYRGIEQITAAVQRLFAKHGVVVVPHVSAVSTIERIINGRPWTDTHLDVAYTIYGPGGSHIEAGPVHGIGRDNSDKGANKAMTMAYKYLLLQLLCISDAADDADAGSPADTPAAKPAGWVASVSRKCDQLGLDAPRIAALLRAADCGPIVTRLDQVMYDQRAAVVEIIRRLDAGEMEVVIFQGTEGPSYYVEPVAPVAETVA